MADSIIQTKLHLPFIRPQLVIRSRLQEQIIQGLRGPLTLLTAPAGFGKTTLTAASVVGCGMPIAWLSLDKNDNQPGSFLRYLVATLQATDHSIGTDVAQILAAPGGAQSEAVLTSLVNDLDRTNSEIVLVLDDYQYISNQAAHEELAFLLAHAPKSLHVVIATRSDPPLPLARFRARGQMVELRAVDLRFRKSEAAQFLTDVMGFHLDEESVELLEERTEGWIAGLQMAALSMRDHKDPARFIEGFSGTNRYILDYLFEEVLTSQPPEIKQFLLFTSILESLTASLCDFILAINETPEFKNDNASYWESLTEGQSASILDYLEQANLFVVPLDDERVWYRYHHLFADLLRAQLQKSLGSEGVAKLHLRAAEWHGQNGSVLDAIHHASMASDAEMVERFIKQNYLEMVSRGEMSRIRFWLGNLNRELVYSRPWLCIYAAYSYAWFGEVEEAIRLLDEADKRLSEISDNEVPAIRGHLAYVKSRVTAMHGDIHSAIELCLIAREYVPANNLAVQLDTLITLGYEYFLCGDFVNAGRNLNEMIRSGSKAGAVINTVAASCVMARLYAIQGFLQRSHDTYQTALRSIPDEGGQHLGARALVEVGMADLLYEWNDLNTALTHMKKGLNLISMWDKADDLVFAYITLARIHSAQGNTSDAIETIKKASQIVQTRGVFPEAQHAVESAQVRIWLAQGDIRSANRWASSQKEHLSTDDLSKFEHELIYISLARVMIAHNKPHEAIDLLSRLEENTQSEGRNGRLLEIFILTTLGMQRMGNKEQADTALSKSLALAEAEGYVRIFLDEGQPMKLLIAQWLPSANSGPLRDYASHILSQFESEPYTGIVTTPANGSFASSGQVLIEPLSPRELEVLNLIALGKTNLEIAQQLFVARGTIKAHAASIYRKLDVTNRTEAVARSRQLGILP